MTLSSSLNAGVAGLGVNASKLGTISDNIANSQTIGYKRVDAEFSNLVLSESSGTYAAGGVRVNSFREVDARGSLTSTNSATDIAIGGRGFLPVAPVSALDNLDGEIPLQLVTTGSFRPDEDGFMRTVTGLTLLGVPANVDGSIPTFARDSPTDLEPVRILATQLSASPTTQIEFSVNLPSDETIPGASGDPIETEIAYFDNVGAQQGLVFTFTPTILAAATSNTWTVEITDQATDAALNPVASFEVQFDDSRDFGGSIAAIPATTNGAYDPTTGFFSFNVAGGPMDLNIGLINDRSRGLTQLSRDFQPTGIDQNGAPVGSINNIDIDENGILSATFEGGFVRNLYQIPLG